ncbi:Hint domain-containing protein [Aliiroseovarius subalbicans]|uniref:Hint domain-containing protein n=1 Tax=Aliiroseovarius subalbicans TaxID=2925840 RepID=UPI001F5823C7|nr:Hint domain-containing protein [Aliiroseovarius subalbicans]MCI2400595.1 Hint domain-containing protein [Aliiroseovarius subalbicans]
MKTGLTGTFVISWSQTEVDGLTGAPRSALGVGASWRWKGKPVRVDGPPEVLLLERASGEADLRRRAARTVHKLVGAAINPTRSLDQVEVDEPLLNVGFEVTDGRRSYTITVIDISPDQPPLLMFLGDVPPSDTDLWVVQAMMETGQVNRMTDQPTGVICFTPGTRIRTPDGEMLVEHLSEGDRIQTKDDGTQEVLWIGQRRISGARLYAMPELRPVRLRGGALGHDRPDGDLVVSPQHRMLVRGAKARALFNTDEVLVAAQDLIDDRRVHLDHSLREVTYYHLLLERHEVVWANGLETESFHPANTALETVEPDQRARLLSMFPDLDYDPSVYGDYARRMLTAPEAAILQSKVA